MRGAALRGFLAVALLAAAPVQATPASAIGPGGARPGLPDLNRLDPARYSYDSAITAWKQVPSRDGVESLWVDYVRPDTADPVPTIMIASPYYNTLGRGWRSELKTPHDARTPVAPGAGPLGCMGCPEVPFPEWYAQYFVPRGYAVLEMDLRGTRNSSGCEVYGDRSEVYDAVDVIDWVAGQSWSNGKVAMVGGSYDGTIALGAAVEMPISGKHKDALAAVIPIRAIDRWYDYHFLNGVESQDHAETPAEFTAILQATDVQNSLTDDLLYPIHLVERRACIATLGAAVDAGYASPYQDSTSAFWAGRDFLKDAAGVRAAVFLVHGLFDFNVKTINSGNFWTELPASVPKKLWYFNGDHADPDTPDVETAQKVGHLLPYTFQDKWRDGAHRWFLQFLKGVNSGALATPAVEVQRNDGTWSAYSAYPAPTADAVLATSTDGTLVRDGASPGTVTWDDSAPGGLAPASQSFITGAFAHPTRLSGQIQFDVAFALSGVDTSLAVQVDDLPPQAGTADPVRSNYYDGQGSTPFTVTYGWARAWYRATINPRGKSSPAGGSALTPNQVYRMSFPSLYTDYVVGAGHRLRFTFSNAAGGTTPSYTGNVVTLRVGPGESAIRLPVAALAGGPPPALVTAQPALPRPLGLPNTSPIAPGVLGSFRGPLAALLALAALLLVAGRRGRAA